MGKEGGGGRGKENRRRGERKGKERGERREERRERVSADRTVPVQGMTARGSWGQAQA